MRPQALCLVAGLVAGLVVGLAAPPAGAHDLWLRPSTFEPAIGELVEVALRIGHPETGGEPLARNDRNIEQIVLLGPAGEVAVPGLDGRHPAGWIRPEEPGTHILVLRGRPLVSVLSAAPFERYLAEEGLEAIVESRARRGESDAPGRERYSRALKALLAVPGSGPARLADRPVGLPLELVARTDLGVLRPGEELTVELRHDGRPRAGVLVEARPLPPATGAEGSTAAASTARPGRSEVVLRARSGDDGRVTFRPLQAGPWLITAVHMERAPREASQDWHSVWTALTFSLGDD